jgi:transposase InsO family protein
MPWKETRAMDARARFVIEAEAAEESFAAICRRYEISRQKGYKWLERWRAEGAAGLADRSRAPHNCPHTIRDEVRERLLELKAAHPKWGPKKLKGWLLLNEPDFPCPAASTIGDALALAGLVKSRKKKRRAPPHEGPFTDVDVPGKSWSADFKGWFRTGDGTVVHPFTVSDNCSRYLVRLAPMRAIEGEAVQAVLASAFYEHGLPEVLRTDNGWPFAGTGVGGMSRLAVWLIKAGVAPERIRPGRPDQNGRHERMHKTLKSETASPPATSFRAQARRLKAFQRSYNEERPHEALGQVPPAQRHAPSPREFTGRLASPEYAEDEEVRRVRSSGEIHWRGGFVFLSRTMVGEPVGLKETEDGVFEVRYGPIRLGRLAGGRLVRPRRAGRARPAEPPPSVAETASKV